MPRRIFVAINLPSNVKKRLNSFQGELDSLFDSFRDENPKMEIIKWTKPENLHITLVFVGLVGDEDLLEISRDCKDIALKYKPFFIKLNRICYGPPQKKPPKMVWAEGEKTFEFSALRQKLQEVLIGENKEKREFSTHITLGRIKKWQWQRIEPEERPQIEKNIGLGFQVESIDIMESELKRKGPKYTLLESHPLGS